jgi:hypothetical protein
LRRKLTEGEWDDYNGYDDDIYMIYRYTNNSTDYRKWDDVLIMTMMVLITSYS